MRGQIGRVWFLGSKKQMANDNFWQGESPVGDEAGAGMGGDVGGGREAI
jgi:hypothetical protein